MNHAKKMFYNILSDNQNNENKEIPQNSCKRLQHCINLARSTDLESHTIEDKRFFGNLRK